MNQSTLKKMLNIKCNILIKPLKSNNKHKDSKEMYDKGNRWVIEFDDKSRLYFKTSKDAYEFAENELNKLRESDSELLTQQITLIGTPKEFERVFEELDGICAEGYLNDYEVGDCKTLPQEYDLDRANQR